MAGLPAAVTTVLSAQPGLPRGRREEKDKLPTHSWSRHLNSNTRKIEITFGFNRYSRSSHPAPALGPGAFAQPSYLVSVLPNNSVKQVQASGYRWENRALEAGEDTAAPQTQARPSCCLPFPWAPRSCPHSFSL